MEKAQKGDLIRIVASLGAITKYEKGGIYEVTGYGHENTVDEQVMFIADGVECFANHDWYVIHRKAGEEDSVKLPSCPNCGATLRANSYDGYCSIVCKSEYTGVSEEHLVGQATADAVNPQHYKQGRVEVIDIIEDAVDGADPFEAVCQANVLKYALRYRHKNGVTDLRKAQWYLEKLVTYLEK